MGFLQLQKWRVISLRDRCEGFPLLTQNSVTSWDAAGDYCVQKWHTTGTTALVYRDSFWMYYSKESSSYPGNEAARPTSALTGKPVPLGSAHAVKQRLLSHGSHRDCLKRFYQAKSTPRRSHFLLTWSSDPAIQVSPQPPPGRREVRVGATAIFNARGLLVSSSSTFTNQINQNHCLNVFLWFG